VFEILFISSPCWTIHATGYKKRPDQFGALVVFFSSNYQTLLARPGFFITQRPVTWWVRVVLALVLLLKILVAIIRKRIPPRMDVVKKLVLEIYNPV